MRPVLKAFASDHPVVVFFAVVFRWIAWTVVGNPAPILVLVVGVKLGADWRLTLATATVTYLLLAGFAFVGRSRISRWLFVWSRMARFRLRWPTVMAAVTGTRQTVIAKALSSNNYSVPGGLRPILDAPALGWFPRVRGTLVSWKVRPAAGRTLADLAEQVDQIAANYKIVYRVDVEYQRLTDHKGRLVVSFTDELSTVEEPAWA